MKNRKIKKILGILVATIVFIIFAVNTFIFPAAIRKQLRHATIGTMKLKVDRIKTHFLTQSIGLSGVHFGDSAGDFSANIDLIKLREIGIVNLILYKKIETDGLIFKDLVIRMRKGYEFPKSGLKASSATSPLKILIKELVVENGTFSLFDPSLKNDSLLSAHLDLDIKNIEFNPDTANFLYKNIGLDELECLVSDVNFLTSDGNYRIKVGSVNFITQTAELVANNLQVIPLRDRYELGKRAGVQSDWFDVQLQRLQLNSIDLKKLLADQEFYLRKIEVAGLKAEVFRDMRLPMPVKPDTKLIPDMVASIPIPVHSDSLYIHTADIRYTERAKNSTDAGHLDLIGTEIISKNFTNIDSLIKQPRVLDIKTKLLNASVLTAQVTLSSKHFPHADRMRGHLGTMPFAAANTMVEYGMSTRFTEGTVHRIDFDFTYNNDVSNGKLTMEYENLKLELIDRNNQSNKKLQSGLVNGLVIRNHNLTGDKRFREGAIHFERDKKKSTYNFWWKSLFSGIKSTVAF